MSFATSKYLTWPFISQVLCHSLHSNVFTGQSPTFPTIKKIKIIRSEYCNLNYSPTITHYA